MQNKVLIIGIDGGTWTILRPAIENGCMPYFDRLIRGGCSGTLLSTTPPKTAAAWSTFQTGMNPGQNGIYDFAYWNRYTKKAEIVNATVLKKTIWEYVSDAQKKVGVINVPMTYPVREINGYTVSGILTPSLESDFTWPREFKKELLENVPGYHILNLKNAKHGTPHKQPGLFVDNLKNMLSNRAKVALHLFKKEVFDLFMIHFQETDVVQHAMWGYMQEGHALFSPDIRSLIFKELFACLDRNIKLLHEAFQEKTGQKCFLFLVSDHGFQTHKKRFNLGSWLKQEGLLVVNPPDYFEHLKNLLRKKRNKRKIPVSFDWDATKVFSFSRGNDGFIYLLEDDENKKRETINLIRNKIMTVVDPDTQDCIARDVLLKEEVYSGEYIDRMPDMIIKPADGYSFTGDYTKNRPLFHPVTIENDFHIGMHHQDGILVANGPIIKQDCTVEGAKIIDVAPTVLAALDVPVPAQMEGSVLHSLFSETIEHRSQQEQTSLKASTQDKVYTEQDIQEIQQRLRDLGYIE